MYSEVGKGSRFKVYLPAVETSELKMAREKQVELPVGHGELILIVDDEASVREVSRAILETHGYRVITAKDGKEGIELYTKSREEIIKLVILDMMMPVMGGLETIQRLREIDPKVRVIGASGLAEKEKLDEVSATEIQFFLLKPYTAETLLKTIHEVLIK